MSPYGFPNEIVKLYMPWIFLLIISLLLDDVSSIDLIEEHELIVKNTKIIIEKNIFFKII